MVCSRKCLSLYAPLCRRVRWGDDRSLSKHNRALQCKAWHKCCRARNLSVGGMVRVRNAIFLNRDLMTAPSVILVQTEMRLLRLAISFWSSRSQQVGSVKSPLSIDWIALSVACQLRAVRIDARLNRKPSLFLAFRFRINPGQQSTSSKGVEEYWRLHQR